MIEVRIVPPYLPLDCAGFFFFLLLPSSSINFIIYLLHSSRWIWKTGSMNHTVCSVVWQKQIKERSRSAAGSNSFYFLEPHHHVGRLKSKYPPSGSAVLKQHGFKKCRNE